MSPRQDMDKVELIIKAARASYREVRNNPNGRYRLWEHCYKCFHDARRNPSPDYNYISSQLAFYLASLVMYSRSSIQFQEEYELHIPVVKELLKPEYDRLLGIDCVGLRNNEAQKALVELSVFMSEYYGKNGIGIMRDAFDSEMRTTLITRVLSGTLACVPVYDGYFASGVKELDIHAEDFSFRSLLALADYYEENDARLEKARYGMRVYGLRYPQMKLLDMGISRIGYKMGFDR